MKRSFGVVLAAAAVAEAFSLSACDEVPASSVAEPVYSEAEKQPGKGIGDIYGCSMESTQKKLEEILGFELEESTPGLFSDSGDSEHHMLADESLRPFWFFDYKFKVIDVELKSGLSQKITFASTDYDRAAAEDMKEALNSFYGTECAGETDGIYYWKTDSDGMVMLSAESYQVILQFAYIKK